MCLLIVHGFLYGDGIDILDGGILGDLILGIGIMAIIIITIIFISVTIQEVGITEIETGMAGIMETMVGGLGQLCIIIAISKGFIGILIQDHKQFKRVIVYLEIGFQ